MFLYQLTHQPNGKYFFLCFTVRPLSGLVSEMDYHPGLDPLYQEQLGTDHFYLGGGSISVSYIALVILLYHYRAHI